MAFVASFLAGVGFVTLIGAIVFCVAWFIYKVTRDDE